MVPKPAHSGCGGWLQSMRAMGRYLSQYSSAADAFAAPGTCKQLTPQITVIYDGAGDRPVPQLQVSLALANNTGSKAQLDTQTQQDTKHVHCVLSTFSCAVV